MCNQQQAVSILSEVYSYAEKLFAKDVLQAYLYGSYARGDYHEESDVDILLTVNMTDDSLAKMRKAVASIASDLSLKHDVTVSIAVKTHEQFTKYRNILPYYQNVVKEGIQHVV